ncbi:AEC family transporter [Marisediminicola senii]|uniref:AEC family transporter n=1 Tax=Marisediminicola senii TaxID=2711233 RepID=UPI0013EC3B24|nr:AEC family transporter [Marisediminicola senii]
MAGVLTGFAIIGSVIAVGYVVERLGILGPRAGFVLNRIVFFVLSPCLLFTVLAEADVTVLFSRLLVVSALAALCCFALYAIVAFGIWRRPVPEALIGTAASGWVNANNIGIPVAVYVIGDPAYVAPVIMFQLIIFTPIVLTILDLRTSGTTSLGRVLMQPIRNPIIIGSALGAIVSATGLEIPQPVLEPFELVGAAAVPVVLIAFGMSLRGQRALAPGSGRRDVLLASAIKIAIMPLIAWALGQFAFGLEGMQLFAVVVMASLPTAQNVFNYAQRYERGEIVARDTVLSTTIGSLPVLLVVAAFLS